MTKQFGHPQTAIRSIWSILLGSVTQLLSHLSTFWDKLVSGDIARKMIQEWAQRLLLNP